MNESQEKVILITGATDGIGRAAAEALARTGAAVVIVGRDPAKAARVVAELQRASGNEKVSALVGDLALQREARRVARAFKDRFQRLDILVNNVGGLYTTRQVTEEGHEQTLALNYLSGFILVEELLPLLERAPAGRIVHVTSDAQAQGTVRFDNLQSEGFFWFGWVYGAAKRMIVMATRELARRLRERGSRVTVNCVHPGFVRTNIGQHNGGVTPMLMRFMMKRFGLTPAEGADALVFLATSPEVAAVSGAYFERRQERRPAAQALDDGACATLWSETERLVAASARAASR